MLVYWLLIGYFAVGAILVRPRADRRSGPIMLASGSLLVALAIGLRYQVGADWETYKFLFSYVKYTSLARLLTIGDPGYQLLNWAVQRIGAEIWVVNLVCGAIFAFGLFRFARAQPDPWLTVVVAIPYAGPMRIVRRWDNHLRFPCNNPQLICHLAGQSLLMGRALTMSALGMPACLI